MLKSRLAIGLATAFCVAGLQFVIVSPAAAANIGQFWDGNEWTGKTDIRYHGTSTWTCTTAWDGMEWSVSYVGDGYNDWYSSGYVGSANCGYTLYSDANFIGAYSQVFQKAPPRYWSLTYSDMNNRTSSITWS